MRLAAGPSASVTLATAVHGAGGRTVRLDAARTYRLGAWRADAIEVVVAVVATTPSDRAATVRVTGTLDVQDVDGPALRRLLGLRSTWFTVSMAP